MARRPPPLETVRRALEGELDPHALARLPRRYFRVGDVLLLDLPLPAPEGVVAAAYARALGMRSVLGRTGGVEGEFRQPATRLLWGDRETETEHREIGVRYRLDPARVMWSHGNLAERQRIAAWNLAGETVVDLFAGVGYFACPLALRAHASRVVAIEKSPQAFAYLRQNVALNRLEGRVETRLGDCRDVAPHGEADRVLLGLLPDSIDFLPTALDTLRPTGGVLHVHRVSPVAAIEESYAEVARRLEERGARPQRLGTHRVKSYAPRLEHVVFDVRVARA